MSKKSTTERLNDLEQAVRQLVAGKSVYFSHLHGPIHAVFPDHLEQCQEALDGESPDCLQDLQEIADAALGFATLKDDDFNEASSKAVHALLDSIERACQNHGSRSRPT